MVVEGDEFGLLPCRINVGYGVSMPRDADIEALNFLTSARDQRPLPKAFSKTWESASDQIGTKNAAGALAMSWACLGREPILGLSVGWVLETSCWRLEVLGWRLEVGG